MQVEASVDGIHPDVLEKALLEYQKHFNMVDFAWGFQRRQLPDYVAGTIKSINRDGDQVMVEIELKETTAGQRAKNGTELDVAYRMVCPKHKDHDCACPKRVFEVAGVSLIPVIKERTRVHTR